MERRDRSLKALQELVYIDSLDDVQRAASLLTWSNKYLQEDVVSSFDLNLTELQKLSELFYKNIAFLKQHQKDIKIALDNSVNIKKFFS